jgi:CubicO group peptidase (beta-lactamase class C family)
MIQPDYVQSRSFLLTNTSKADMSNPLPDLQEYVNALIEIHQVPAASVAVWKDGQLQQAAAGILNLDTQVKATTDTIFQIGSITKVMTTCLVMQLVDEGRVDLDRPVKHYIRDFQIADPEATQAITVRQLLNHTSGMAGDFFPDTNGHQGNLIARYVDRCNLLPLVHPVGALFSYSNSAFVIAGRLIEVVRGISWCQAIEEYLFQPLGMTHSIADPKEALRYRAAMGHVLGDNGALVLSDETYSLLGLAPITSAADLITFARAHLDGGVSQTGKRWLSEESVEAMQTPSIEPPQVSQICRKYFGLGWGPSHYTDTDSHTFGHAGATHGFMSVLQVFPKQQAAYAVLLNASKPAALNAAVKDLCQAVAGIDLTEPEPPEFSGDMSSLQRVTGKYESFDTVAEIVIRDGKLKAHIVYKIDPLPPLDLLLTPIDSNCFAAYTEEGKRTKNLAFIGENINEPPDYLFFGERLSNRIG